MPESSFPVFFPAGFALSGWKTACKTARGGGSHSGCGVTGVTSLPAVWYSRGALPAIQALSSLELGIFTPRVGACAAAEATR